MAVLIKGMQMPKGCNECHRYYWSNIDQVYKCNLTKSELQVKDAVIEPNIDCPLVEIPKGARLIDANKIIKAMDNMQVEGEVFTTAVNYVKLIVSDAPTIVEEGEE